MSRPFPFRRVYGPAAAIAALTLYGLISSLLGDGAWDEIAWIALAAPLAVIAWKYSRATRRDATAGEDGNVVRKGGFLC